MEYNECVKCGKPKEQGEECPFCGVYYAKAEAALLKKIEVEREAEETTAPVPLENEIAGKEEGQISDKKPTKNSFSRAFQKTANLAAIALLVIVAVGFLSISLDSHDSTPSNNSSYKRTSSPSTTIPTPSYAEAIVIALNTAYGNICHAELNGFFNKTLKIDWTGETRAIHSIKVLAEIGEVKEKLYNDGVRYIQFPNDAGTYNVIDWKTGEKKSISEHAKYYFQKR